MPPKNRQIRLICPKCNRKGFLRKKQSKFHLPQKNSVKTLYDLLDYLSKLNFKFFLRDLNFDPKFELKLGHYPLKKYNNSFTFFKFSKRKIKEFEKSAICRIIKKSRGNIVYTKDLTKSIHLIHLITNGSCNSDEQTQKIKVCVSRRRLIYLFNSIFFAALKKLCELYQSSFFFKDVETEMVDKLVQMYYSLSLNVDRRNEWHFPLTVDIDEDSKNVNFKLLIPDESSYWIRCKNCRKSYLDTSGLVFCTKCHEILKFYYSKEKPSRNFLKKKYKELDSLNLCFLDSALAFYDFKSTINDLFSTRQIVFKFQEFFAEISKQTLANLKMPGKTYYHILHYQKDKSYKDECYISKEADFLNIEIKVQTYCNLIKSLVKVVDYGNGKNSIWVLSELIDLLEEINFSEKYILFKIYQDYKKYSKYYFNEQIKKILLEHDRMILAIAKKIRNKGYNDINIIRYDIESTLYNCVTLIVNKKLLPIDEINKYKILENQFRRPEEIPKHMLFQALSFVSSIDAFNLKVWNDFISNLN